MGLDILDMWDRATRVCQRRNIKAADQSCQQTLWPNPSACSNTAYNTPHTGHKLQTGHDGIPSEARYQNSYYQDHGMIDRHRSCGKLGDADCTCNSLVTVLVCVSLSKPKPPTPCNATASAICKHNYTCLPHAKSQGSSFRTLQYAYN